MAGQISAIILSLFALLTADPAATPHDARAAVPNSAKQGPVLYKLKTEYKAEYAKREASDQLALANTFLKAAEEPGVEQVKRYVLLREARELAVNGGDLHAAFAAIDDIAREFALDASEMKTTAIAASMGRSRAPPLQMLDQYLKVADESLADGDVQLAFQASRLATKVARESRDAGALSRAKQVELHVNDVNRQIKVIVTAGDKLKAHPDDAAANFAVGQYWCFFRGNWEEGLGHLAKGSDPQLAGLAREDLANPRDPAGIMKIAGEWWNFPDSPQTPQRRARERAVHWYEVALPKLGESDKRLASQRIAEGKRK